VVKDTALAERLLAEAGWLRNVQGIATMPGKTLEFQLAVPSSDPALMRVAAELRLQWLALGVQTKLRLLDPTTFQKAVATQDFDAMLSRGQPTTTWDLGRQWHSNSSNNVTGFSHRLLDLLIEALEQDFDPTKAAEHTQQAEAILLDNHAVLPLLLTHETTSLRTELVEDDQPAGWTLENLLLR
jgi:ABC-type transport system substrate-binding protein